MALELAKLPGAKKIQTDMGGYRIEKTKGGCVRKAYATPAQKDIAKFGRNYDPTWLDKQGKDREDFDWFQSKLKTDQIFRYGVFKVEDVFAIYVNYRDPKDGTEKETEVKFTITALSPSNGSPTFQITATRIPAFSETKTDMTAPEKMMNFLMEKGFTSPNLSRYEGRFSKHLNVWRDDDFLDDFDTFKHKFHIWVEEEDMKAVETGVQWRMRSTDDTTPWMRLPDYSVFPRKSRKKVVAEKETKAKAKAKAGKGEEAGDDGQDDEFA